MDDVVYRSRVRIEQAERPLRRAYLPAENGPVHFGTHGPVAEHYGVEPEVEHATTIDYIVAATAG